MSVVSNQSLFVFANLIGGYSCRFVCIIHRYFQRVQRRLGVDSSIFGTIT